MNAPSADLGLTKRDTGIQWSMSSLSLGPGPLAEPPNDNST